MTRYLLSDHHFNHENIIKYTDRPFDSVEEMNSKMKERWNSVVSEDDPVLHVGDVAFTSSDTKNPADHLADLNGTPTLILGNHDDSINEDDFPYLCVESTILQHHGYRFWCTHRPEEVPDYWTEWIIHGHVHNDHPFIEYNKNKINVSVECLDYTPLPLHILVKALKNMNSGDVAQDIHDSPISDFQWFHQNMDE